MQIANQRDYPGILLDTDPSDSVAAVGCTALCVYNGLQLAGYVLSVPEYFAAMKTVNAFTNETTNPGQPQNWGYLIWGRIALAYPQFHFQENSDYQLCEGIVNGRDGNQYTHWVLLHNGIYYNSLGGTTDVSYMVGLKPMFGARILQAPVPVQVGNQTNFWVQTTDSINVRVGPHRNSGYIETYGSGSQIQCSGYFQGDDVEGETRWCKSAVHGYYFTAKYVKEIPTPN